MPGLQQRRCCTAASAAGVRRKPYVWQAFARPISRPISRRTLSTGSFSRKRGHSQHDRHPLIAAPLLRSACRAWDLRSSRPWLAGRPGIPTAKQQLLGDTQQRSHTGGSMMQTRTVLGGTCLPTGIRHAAARPARSLKAAVRASGGSDMASNREEALRAMQAFKAGLGKQLERHEEELKKVVASAAATADAPAAAADTAVRDITAAEWQDVCDAADAEGKLVMLTFTSKTCGPCKIMAPRIDAMSLEYSGAVFVKMYTVSANKALGTALGVKAAPSFMGVRKGEKLFEVTGTKEAELRSLIEANM